jgi:aryl-alcohol dehydrogenase-like predicted oxidoreductase
VDRRKFLERLAAVTSGLLLTPSELSDWNTTERDRLGDLLPQRKLGSTGEAVTMMGVGGWHIGGMSERDAQATIEAALEGGVRFFDSAESYQDGGSERYLGRFLTPKYREEIFLMTKTNSFTAEQTRGHLEASLRRLNTEYLDLWQVHSLDDPSDVDSRIEEGVFDVVRQAKEEGKVRHIGFTGHERPSAHQRVLERINDFETCQMPINVADPSYNSFIENVLPPLVERNMGILAMKTLANGRFFGDSPIIPDRVSIREALHFVWSLPVSTLITGPDNVDQMKENVELARSFEGMSEDDRQRLIKKVSDLAGTETEYYKA